MRKTVEILPQRNIVLYHEDDVSDVLEQNKQLRSMPQKRDRVFNHVASIPSVIIVKWLDEERNRGHEVQFLSKEFDELTQRKLNDPEWKYLRVDK